MASNVTFKFNPGWERELAKQANAAIEKQFQPVLDGISRECRGLSVPEIKPILAQRWASANDGARVTEPELSTLAQAISEGKRILIRGGKIIAS
ncbi:hypothetical protein [Herbiconiux sp. YIM B11900]|uniref:hypothetical protein n=1 Tax=Herbiconiux sp. YIM B11900 TaxID=3404131 RepID=UPI003F8395DA